eukprot:TRINITY_DN24631_c0_g1_i4.p1 TRINITY_DN24631_c0_g1~~TRINITY_DN24631_c0_g1_i4.p1  ORF type:complete len:149 (-),score=34.29 TRINITY_DN24631_c0_g1_i4:219-665(-)
MDAERSGKSKKSRLMAADKEKHRSEATSSNATATGSKSPAAPAGLGWLLHTKITPCTAIRNKQVCPYGSACPFAHSLKELGKARKPFLEAIEAEASRKEKEKEKGKTKRRKTRRIRVKRRRKAESQSRGSRSASRSASDASSEKESSG